MPQTILSVSSDAPVFMFSGQGSQTPGMGRDLLGNAEVAKVFACATEVLGFDVADLVLHASPEKLNDTRFAQPALCALSIGIARALEAQGVRPSAVLGFSLGQISALGLSGMLSDQQVFELVQVRSELMAQAALNNPGAMSALLKADEASVLELCKNCAEGEVLVPANFNCPGQIVIAGTVAAIERAEQAWAAAGKRSSRLATSGAFHSPLMQEASEAFSVYLAGVEFTEPRVPLICNVDAAALAPADAQLHLARHLVNPVRFAESVVALRGAGACVFAEVGYGGVLANLVRRIDKEAERVCVQDSESFEAFVVARTSA